MTLSRIAARGAATTLSGQWAKFVIQGTALVVLARLLDPVDFGVYAMVMAIAGLALLFGDFGLSMASIQAHSISDAQRSNLFWVNVLIGLTCALALLGLSGPIAAFYGQPELSDVTKALALVFLLQAVSAQFSANASRDFRFRVLAWMDVSAQAVAVAVAVAAALAGWGYWALVLQQISVAVVNLIVLLSTTRWWPTIPKRGAPVRDMLKFGSSTMGVQAINYASANVDSILLGRLWGAEALGIYDRAYQVFKLPLQQIAAPMTRVALPVLSRISDNKVFDQYIGRAQVVLIYLLGGAFSLAVATSEPLMALVLGPGWGNAPLLFAILAAGGVFQSMGYVYYWIFLAKGKTGLQLKFSIFTRSLMVGLLALGAIWGAVGVAVAASGGLFMNWLVLTLFAVPRTGVDTLALVGKVVAPLTVYGSMVAVVYPLSLLLRGTMSDWGLLGTLLLVCSAYLAMSYVLVPRIRRDLRLIHETIRKGLAR